MARNIATRAERPLPAPPPEELRLALPPHAAPRSLSLAAPSLDVDLADLEARSPGWDYPYGLTEAIVPTAACDGAGFLRLTSAQDITLVTTDAGGEAFSQPLGAREDRTFAWTMKESRQVLLETPRAGDRVRSVSAHVGIGRKTFLNRRWTYTAETRRVLGVCDSTILAFDLDARRSIDIPPHARAWLEGQHLPELLRFAPEPAGG